MNQKSNYICNVGKALCVALVVFLSVLCLTGCSSTSSVPDDDKLFTGLKKINYENYEPSAHFYSTQEEVEAALATAPNGALFCSSYYRSPFPYRLWIYNAFHNSETRFSQWVRKSFGKAPVLLSGVNPRLRAQVARELLRARGYFGADVDYNVIEKPGAKTA